MNLSSSWWWLVRRSRAAPRSSWPGLGRCPCRGAQAPPSRAAPPGRVAPERAGSRRRSSRPAHRRAPRPACRRGGRGAASRSSASSSSAINRGTPSCASARRISATSSPASALVAGRSSKSGMPQFVPVHRGRALPGLPAMTVTAPAATGRPPRPALRHRRRLGPQLLRRSGHPRARPAALHRGRPRRGRCHRRRRRRLRHHRRSAAALGRPPGRSPRPAGPRQPAARALAVATLGYGLPGGLAVLVLFRLLAGIGEAATFIGAATTAQDLAPADQRAGGQPVPDPRCTAAWPSVP